MRKIIFAALAAMVMFASCDKENATISNEGTFVSVKISGEILTKVLEQPGVTTNSVVLDPTLNHHIFVLNPLGDVTYNEALDITDATTTGQLLASQVAADSRVYVVCNIPTSDYATLTGKTNFTGIQTATSLMTTQSDYKKAALANSNGTPAAITVIGTTATVNVSIKPLISRMELVQVKGGANITAFTVKGVYVDSYHPSFTYGGSFGGTMHSQGTSTSFTGIGDPGTWAAALPSPLVAAPSSGNVWAHNLASGGLPRFIIALEGVKYDKGAGEQDLSGTTYYLTVTGYTGLGSSVFERGKIYRIGGVNGITFTEDDLGLTPNPVDVDLTLEVTIEEWVLVTPEAVL